MLCFEIVEEFILIDLLLDVWFRLVNLKVIDCVVVKDVFFVLKFGVFFDNVGIKDV